MKNLTTAIFGKLSGSDFSSDIGGRLFKGQAPEGAVYPYCVYSVVSIEPERTFSELFKHVTIKFSLFSTESGTTEIETMFTNLKALYDERSFSITGSTLVWMRRTNAMFSVEDRTTKSGTQQVWAYHVDFDAKTSLD